MREPAPLRFRDGLRWLTAFGISAVAFVSIIGNRIHAQGNDAVFSQNLVDRALRFGGSYYENGIHPKGPLEEVAHDIARRIGGYDGHWYVISVMIMISSAIIAWAAARTARVSGGNQAIAVAVAIVVFVHFTLSNSAYAGLLYSRNIMVTLLAAAWMLAIAEWPWRATARVQTASAIAIGALIGLAVQTIIPSALEAAAVGITALVLVGGRIADRERAVRLRLTIVVAALGGCLSAPVWYLLRGSFRAFWASWWTYAGYQNRAVGLSFAQELSKGWHVGYAYYQHRPLLFALIAAFVAYTVFSWQSLDGRGRIIHVALLAWLAGGWAELVASERYSDHYFSVIALPTALIGAAFAGDVVHAAWHLPRVRRSAIAWPLVGLLLVFYLSSDTSGRFIDAVSMTSGFTSAARGAQLSRANQSATHSSIQAVLDLVSRDQDPLLLYDDNQFIYNDYRRIPATRFPQRYFIIGSVYLARTSPKYVLAGTQRLFEHDMHQANPAAFLETRTVDSTIVSKYVAAHYELAFTGKDGKVHLRDDAARSVLAGAAPADWTAPEPPASDQGWTVTGDSATFVQRSRPPSQDRLVLATAPCERIDGVVQGTAGNAPGVYFHVLDPTGKRGEGGLSIDDTTAASRGGDGGELESQPISRGGAGSVTFSIVSGEHAAVLVVNGKIVAAIKTSPNAVIQAEPLRSDITLSGLHVGPASVGSGCAGS